MSEREIIQKGHVVSRVCLAVLMNRDLSGKGK